MLNPAAPVILNYDIIMTLRSKSFYEDERNRQNILQKHKGEIKNIRLIKCLGALVLITPPSSNVDETEW